MIKKIYDYFKELITENYLYLLFLLVSVATLTYPLPYYIYNGGGLIDVDNKVEFDGKTESKGSYNMSYVQELRATIPTYLLSFVMKDWDLVKKEKLTANDDETDKDIKLRDRIYLDTGNINALVTAFNYANKEYNIVENKFVVVYKSKNSENDIEIGDEIISVNNIDIKEINDIIDAINSVSIGDKIDIVVRNDNRIYNRYAYVYEDNNKKYIGISLEEKLIIETEPKIEFKFNKNEYGPSGGLMLSLALYDYLVKEDVTKGLKIAGTGTIDKNGNVGSIGGVKYKLSGAVKKKADVFFVPIGENYEEAIKLKKKNNYKIKIVGVSNFKDAINYLEEI